MEFDIGFEDRMLLEFAHCLCIMNIKCTFYTFQNWCSSIIQIGCSIMSSSGGENDGDASKRQRGVKMMRNNQVLKGIIILHLVQHFGMHRRINLINLLHRKLKHLETHKMY